MPCKVYSGIHNLKALKVYLGAILSALWIWQCSFSDDRRENQVCFKDRCLSVELAVTRKEMERGLQRRASLDPRKGMLFIFPREGPYSFWMKDTLIPLDMIWLDESRKVVYIAHQVQPCRSDPCPSYTPSSKALYVLEINAGYAQKLDIHEGDEARFKMQR